MKDNLSSVQSLINEKVNEEQQSAINKLEGLKNKITSMAEYSKLADTDVQQVNAKFAYCKSQIESQTLIAIIKTLVSDFESKDYTELLNFVIQASQPKVEVTATPSGDDAVAEPIQVKKPEIVHAQKISIKYSKPLLSNASEVEEYVNSLKNAMLEEINNGKQIQI